jgi:hypothetical protein
VLTAKKFASLLNGGASLAGVKGMASEIQALEAEMESARAELCTVPARRADLILQDDAAAQIDKLEARERELERLLERNSIQIDPLKKRLFELRRDELAPRIAHHQNTLSKIEQDIATAVQVLIELNRSADEALKSACYELGDEGIPLMPVVHFGGSANELSLEIWAGNLERQREVIANHSKPKQPYKSPIDLSNMEGELFAMITGNRRPW